MYVYKHEHIYNTVRYLNLVLESENVDFTPLKSLEYVFLRGHFELRNK